MIDEKKGRKVAQINRIKTIGSVGVLIQAKKVGLIKHVKPSIDLIIASQIYMSSELINAVLAMADEHY